MWPVILLIVAGMSLWMVVAASTMSVYSHLFDHCASNTSARTVSGAWVGRRGRVLTRARASQNGWTPLLIAAYRGHFAVVEHLVAKGADMNAPAMVRGGGWVRMLNVQGLFDSC